MSEPQGRDVLSIFIFKSGGCLPTGGNSYLKTHYEYQSLGRIALGNLSNNVLFK